MNKLLPVALLAFVFIVVGVFQAEARPEYAQKENKQCGYCHLSSGGGGARGFRGQFYGANGLSFASFDEEREASIAGVAANAEASSARPKVNYVGNVAGPADKQIQLASIRGAEGSPVLVAFFDSASDDAKAAAKLLKKVAIAYGRRLAVIGVVEGGEDMALKLTKELGSQLRVLPDPQGVALKKFGPGLGLDLVVVAPKGDPGKLISGVSKGTLNTAIAQIGVYGIAAPESLDLADAPDKELHGAKLGSKL